MKPFFTLFFSLCISGIFFGQEKSLLKILNRELKYEVKNQFKSHNFEDDTISIVEPFTVSEDKILSFEIKKSNLSKGEEIIKQEVPLSKIRKIGKDLQIILETEPNAVTTTYINQDEITKPEIVKGNLFFLYLFNEKQTETLGTELQNAFQNAGFSVEKENWYDN